MFYAPQLEVSVAQPFRAAPAPLGCPGAIGLPPAAMGRPEGVGYQSRETQR